MLININIQSINKQTSLLGIIQSILQTNCLVIRHIRVSHI